MTSAEIGGPAATMFSCRRLRGRSRAGPSLGGAARAGRGM